MVPLRAAPVFGATENCTVPLPVPLPDVTLIQGAPVAAVQAHPTLVVTLNDPDPPADGNAAAAGAEIEYVQPLAWTTVKVWFPMVTVPRRSASGFGATVSCTEPVPDPLLPDAMVIQPALLVALHEQPVAAVTVTGTDPPLLPIFWGDGEIPYEQPMLCVTVNVCPPAVIVPVRCGPVLAAAEYRTVAVPLPVAPAVTLSQFALLAAAQAQPASVRTSNVPVPPPAGADPDVADRENVQPCPWLMVKVRPAIVIVPDRPGPVVGSTLNATLPLPLPVVPDVTAIHGAWLAAVHAHPGPAVTVTVPVPPVAATDWVSGEMANVQPSA